MSHAVCIKCRRYVTWRARRGVRLSDLKCPVPECGGDLQAYKELKHGKNLEYAGYAVWK